MGYEGIKMKSTASVAWLIIFLSLIVMGIYSLWGYGWHLRKTRDLREEIESLKGKIEKLEKEQRAGQLLPSISPLSTPSASPLPKTLISPLPELKREATNSSRGQ